MNRPNSFIFLSQFLIILAIVLSPLPSEGRCNACGENGIACTSETTFYMCFNGVPNTNKVQTCPNGKICSRLDLKCIDRDMGVAADCIPNEGCGICDGNSMFTCISRTQFAQCNDTIVTRNTGECPPDWTCDSKSAEVCVSPCNLPAKIECDRDTVS